jgi:hypothetical protein
MFLQRLARTSGSASTIPADRVFLPLIALLAVSLFSPASSLFSLSHLVARCPYLSPRLLSCPPVSTALSPVSPALLPIRSPVLLNELPALLLILPASLPPPCLTCLPAQTLISRCSFHLLISPTLILVSSAPTLISPATTLGLTALVLVLQRSLSVPILIMPAPTTFGYCAWGLGI